MGVPDDEGVAIGLYVAATAGIYEALDLRLQRLPFEPVVKILTWMSHSRSYHSWPE